ncbi:MAG: general secretion pathway protein GspB [Candidatus Wenzhouxiangella sp. M2_3B_020]
MSRAALTWLWASVLASAIGVSAGDAPAQADPMRPPTPSELARFGPQTDARPDESFRLQSVLIAPNRRVAIVNDQRVGTGDDVDGARVTAIEPDGVVLEFDGRTIDLKVRTWSDQEPE